LFGSKNALRAQPHLQLASDRIFLSIDHVQLAMPAGKESVALDFYSGLLGMNEVQKPSELAKRRGCWLESGSVQLHLGVENDFHSAKKAHPAMRCSYYDGLLAKLTQGGS
jgi:4-hydroxyphenylpyruvate dioxygenase-like putative hemolysin